MDKFLENWTEELDELEIQLDLGEDEATEAFETQKGKFRELIDKSKASLEKLGLDEKASHLKAELEHLQVQLALGKAESKDAFEAQKEKMDQALHKAKDRFQGIKSSTDNTYDEVVHTLDKASTDFQTRMDMMRLQMALGKADARDAMEEKKKEIRHKLTEVRTKVKQREEAGEEKWESFSEEIGEAYDHFKHALKGLFS